MKSNAKRKAKNRNDNINRGWKLRNIIIIKIDVPEIRHYAEGKCTHQMTKCIRSTEISEPFSFADIFHLFVWLFFFSISVCCCFLQSLPLRNMCSLCILWAFHKESLWNSIQNVCWIHRKNQVSSTLSKYRLFFPFRCRFLSFSLFSSVNKMNENTVAKTTTRAKVIIYWVACTTSFHALAANETKINGLNCIFYP